MPTEKRKIQNRVNQRRYRMQMKHRIETLERILDARSAAGLCDNSAHPGSNSNNTLNGVEQANQDHFGGHPVASDNSNSLVLCSSDPEQVDDSEGLDVTLQPSAPWLPYSQSTNDLCTDINLIVQNMPVADFAGSDESLMTLDSDSGLSKTKEQRTDEIMASLREENRLLKDAVLELSKAVANMYCTSKTQPSKKDVTHTRRIASATSHFPQYPSPLVTSDNTPLGSGASSRESLLSFQDIENLLLSEDTPSPANERPSCFQFSDSAPTLPHGDTWELTANTSAHPHTITHQTPIFDTLPLPTSYAYTEPTFSLRLARAVYECGYCMLTSGHFSPEDVERVFGFFLKFSNRIALLEKMSTYLGVSRLGFSNGQAIQHPNEQTWLHVPDLRDYENDWGEWVEVNKVEEYLQSLGWSVEGLPGYKSCFPLLPSDRGHGGGLLEHDEPRGELSMTEPLNWDHFDSGGNVFGAPGDVFEDASIIQAQPSVHAEVKPHATNGHDTSLSSNYRQGFLYLDVDRFTTNLIDRTTCLGRTAGFRRLDVDEVLNNCLVKG